MGKPPDLGRWTEGGGDFTYADNHGPHPPTPHLATICACALLALLVIGATWAAYHAR